MDWVKKGKIFEETHAQLPIVDSYNSSYRIYYSTRDNQGRSIPRHFGIDKKDFKRLYWNQNSILELGKPGSFDSHGVMPTEIITLEDGTKYLYYIGWSKRLDVPYWNSIGLAISKDDGITWKKYSEGPIFTTSAKEPNFIGTISISRSPIYGFIMLYSSASWELIEGKLEPIYGIKSAHSNDGINWNIIKYINLNLTEDEGGIASARILNSKVFYSIRKKYDYRTNQKNTYKIKSFDIFNGKENLELEPEGDELMCAYPFVIEEEDKYIMFYNTDFGKNGIYYAECKK